MSPLDTSTKLEAITELHAKTTIDADFYVLLLGSILLATGAIFIDSIPVLIASMLVAPLAYPILGLGLGVTVKDHRLFMRSLIMLILSCLIAIGVAAGLTVAFGHDQVTDKYISFAGNREIAVVIAVVSGIIAAYGMVKPKVASAITGTAIAVSLLPPLAATGIGLAPGGETNTLEAFTLFLLNVIGILLASICVFIAFNMKREYQATTHSQQENS